MYENPGQKLKAAITVSTAIAMMLICLGGLMLMIQGALIAGILVAAIGCLVVWLSGLLTATIADIAINTEEIAYNTRTLLNENRASKQNANVNQGVNVPNQQPQNGQWRCSSCGKINPSYMSTCYCGNNKRNN